MDDLIEERTRLEAVYADRSADPKARQMAAQGLTTIRRALEAQQVNKEANANDGYVETGDPYSDRVDGGMFRKAPPTPPVQWWGPSISTQGVPQVAPKEEPPVTPEIAARLAAVQAGPRVGFSAKQSKLGSYDPFLAEARAQKLDVKDLPSMAEGWRNAQTPEVTRENMEGKGRLGWGTLFTKLADMNAGLAQGQNFGEASSKAVAGGFREYDQAEAGELTKQQAKRKDRIEDAMKALGYSRQDINDANTANLAKFARDRDLIKMGVDLTGKKNQELLEGDKTGVQIAMGKLSADKSNADRAVRLAQITAQLGEKEATKRQAEAYLNQFGETLIGRPGMKPASLDRLTEVQAAFRGQAPKEAGEGFGIKGLESVAKMYPAAVKYPTLAKAYALHLTSKNPAERFTPEQEQMAIAKLSEAME